MVRARIEPRFDTIHSRLLVMFLAFAQPLVRGWSRYFTWLHFKRTPGSVIAQHEKLPPVRKLAEAGAASLIGTKKARIVTACLREIFTLLDQENWRYSIDTGWQEWDIQIYGNFWWSIILRTVTEYHGGGKCLTRVQLRYRYVTTTVIVNLIVLTLFIYHFLNTGHVQLFFAVPYALFALFLFLRARRLKTRVRELVDFAAYRINMNRILRSRLRAAIQATARRSEIAILIALVAQLVLFALRLNFSTIDPGVDAGVFCRLRDSLRLSLTCLHRPNLPRLTTPSDFLVRSPSGCVCWPYPRHRATKSGAFSRRRDSTRRIQSLSGRTE